MYTHTTLMPTMSFVRERSVMCCWPMKHMKWLKSREHELGEMNLIVSHLAADYWPALVSISSRRSYSPAYRMWPASELVGWNMWTVGNQQVCGSTINVYLYHQQHRWRMKIDSVRMLCLQRWITNFTIQQLTWPTVTVTIRFRTLCRTITYSA